MFGLSYVLLKLVFMDVSFISGLFWSRMGMVLGAIILISIPNQRKAIFSAPRRSSGESKVIFISNKVLAGAASVLIYYAVKIGDVVFVNAIQGVQYVFILVFGTILAKKFPQLFDEHEHDIALRKVFGTICIVLGLVLLFV